MVVRILPNDSDKPPGKLADAELHFEEGTLAGLKLVGFAIWERRGKTGRNVTFPARQYLVNGERRSFSLLRPITDLTTQERLRALLLEAYDAWQSEARGREPDAGAQPETGSRETREGEGDGPPARASDQVGAGRVLHA